MFEWRLTSQSWCSGREKNPAPPICWFCAMEDAIFREASRQSLAPAVSILSRPMVCREFKMRCLLQLFGVRPFRRIQDDLKRCGVVHVGVQVARCSCWMRIRRVLRCILTSFLYGHLGLATCLCQKCQGLSVEQHNHSAAHMFPGVREYGRGDIPVEHMLQSFGI